jgi:hypothetical protein
MAGNHAANIMVNLIYKPYQKNPSESIGTNGPVLYAFP